jgi:hypothetical protein
MMSCPELFLVLLCVVRGSRLPVVIAALQMMQPSVLTGPMFMHCCLHLVTQQVTPACYHCFHCYCRELKMCTWLGKWHEGGALWQHEYLAAFEDPFDAADNTARTLGTAVSRRSAC